MEQLGRELEEAEFVLTVKQKQVCEAAVKTSERRHQVVFWIVL